MGSGKEHSLFMPIWNKSIKEGGERPMKQIKFRAKLCGRISFLFSECQMRPKIRVCEATFSPSTEIWQPPLPAIQPKVLYVCPCSKRQQACGSHHLPRLPQPWLFPEGQVPALLKLHVPPSTMFISQLHRGNEWCQIRCQAEHSSPTDLGGTAAACYIANPTFSAKTWACARGKSWKFWLLSFFKSSGSMWPMSFDDVTQDFFFCCSFLFI